MSTAQPTPTVVSFGPDVLDRMVLAVEKVRERLHRSTQALEAAGIPYAVVGGNAVAAWVSKVDPDAARNTVDVDLMINRADLEAVKVAMASAGFIYQEVYGVHMFLDGPDGRPRSAVHILFAGEKVDPSYTDAAPEVTSLGQHEAYKLVDLEPLVRMKLTSFRRKDQVHIQDLMNVRLVDETWVSRLTPELAARLQELVDEPEDRTMRAPPVRAGANSSNEKWNLGMDESLLQQILEMLHVRKRAATYGAVAGLVGSTPQSVMSGRPTDHRHSWVVNARSGLPTDYLEHQIDPALEQSIQSHGVIRTPEDLQEWLAQSV
jgi:hypothetical protein